MYIEDSAKEQILCVSWDPMSVEKVRVVVDPARIAQWESNEKLEHTKVVLAYAREHAYELMEALVKDDMMSVLE